MITGRRRISVRLFTNASQAADLAESATVLDLALLSGNFARFTKILGLAA